MIQKANTSFEITFAELRDFIFEKTNVPLDTLSVIGFDTNSITVQGADLGLEKNRNLKLVKGSLVSNEVSRLMGD